MTDEFSIGRWFTPHVIQNSEEPEIFLLIPGKEDMKSMLRPPVD